MPKGLLDVSTRLTRFAGPVTIVRGAAPALTLAV
jgi:hypothetical protein